MIIRLAKPELMNIANNTGEVFIGGSQDWYEDKWHKKSGCGPVAATNLVYYQMRRSGLDSDYFLLMREMYDYVTPTLRGVNSSGIFTAGVERFATANGIQISTVALDIPKKKRDRPRSEKLKEFIVTSLNMDSPVTFLNLSNGAVSKLQSWHWVTIIAIDADKMLIEISDYGKIIEINISEWLETSMLGGAMVYIITRHSGYQS